MHSINQKPTSPQPENVNLARSATSSPLGIHLYRRTYTTRAGRADLRSDAPPVHIPARGHVAGERREAA